MSSIATAPEARRGFKIQINDQTYQTDDPVLTGRQILDLARLRPADEFIVLEFLQDGLLEEIRLEETADLRKAGVERFITFRTDRSFRFILDGRQFEWGAPLITGRKLKELAGVDPEGFEVWQEIHSAEDRKIGNRDQVDLNDPGTERFFTAKKTTTEG